MTYELAKKLKDAGFPQKIDILMSGDDFKDGADVRSLYYRDAGFHSVYDSSCGEDIEDLKKKPVEEWFGKGRATCYFKREYLESVNGRYLTCYNPSLSELIEACQNGKYFQLSWMVGTKKWEAYSGFGFGPEKCTNSIGETPEEAVANLWLKLNKK